MGYSITNNLTSSWYSHMWSNSLLLLSLLHNLVAVPSLCRGDNLCLFILKNQWTQLSRAQYVWGVLPHHIWQYCILQFSKWLFITQNAERFPWPLRSDFWVCILLKVAHQNVYLWQFHAFLRCITIWKFPAACKLFCHRNVKWSLWLD